MSIRSILLRASTGIANFGFGDLFMILVGGLLLYLAIRKRFEPLLLVPIGFGAILSNIPVAGIGGPDGLLGYISLVGIATEEYGDPHADPPLLDRLADPLGA